MAHYCKIERMISNDQKFNQLSDAAQLAFFRLLVHPHLTVLGAMRGSMAGYAGELGWPLEIFQQALGELRAAGMVKVDEAAHFLWFPNFLKYNAPESPNVVKSWEKALNYLPECALKGALVAHAKAFIKGFPPSFHDALPPHFSQATSSSVSSPSKRLIEEVSQTPDTLREDPPGISNSLPEGVSSISMSLSKGSLGFSKRLSEEAGEISKSLREASCSAPDSLSAGVRNLSNTLHPASSRPRVEGQGKPSNACGSKADEVVVPLSEGLREGSADFFNSLSEGVGQISKSLSKGPPDFSKSLREPVTVTVTEAVTEAVTETEEGVLPHIVAPARPGGVASPDVLFVFTVWKTTLGHPQAILDDKRKSLIRQRLKSGYSVDQLCQAIAGCSLTPYNMGKNDRGQRYDGLHVILKDADQIDRFIHNAQSPPRERNAAQTLIDSNLVVCQEWAQDKLQQEEKVHAVQ